MKFKLANRLITIGWSTVNTLSGSVFSVLLSILVIRYCSKELWGSMVQILLWFGLVSHVIYFGNQNLLLREFSLMPKSISENWSKCLQSRALVFILISLVLFCIPINLKLKLILFLYLAANFIYRSYDVTILFKRQFLISLILEAGGFIIITTYILIERKNLSLNRLVAVFAAAEVLKTTLIYMIYKSEFKIEGLKPNLAYFTLALPFFLLEFTGLLQSKTDLICVTSFLQKDKIAQYQVYINFLLIVQSAAGFILAPFIKNIYRLNGTSIKKLALIFFGIGLALAFGSMFFINLFIRYFYHFTIPPITLVAGAFFIIPIYYYTIVIYRMIKSNHQKTIILLNIAGAIISFVLNIILIPICGYGIGGAIFAISITQWVMLLFYFICSKKLLIQ